MSLNFARLRRATFLNFSPVYRCSDSTRNPSRAIDQQCHHVEQVSTSPGCPTRLFMSSEPGLASSAGEWHRPVCWCQPTLHSPRASTPWREGAQPSPTRGSVDMFSGHSADMIPSCRANGAAPARISWISHPGIKVIASCHGSARLPGFPMGYKMLRMVFIDCPSRAQMAVFVWPSTLEEGLIHHRSAIDRWWPTDRPWMPKEEVAHPGSGPDQGAGSLGGPRAQDRLATSSPVGMRCSANSASRTVSWRSTPPRPTRPRRREAGVGH